MKEKTGSHRMLVVLIVLTLSFSSLFMFGPTAVEGEDPIVYGGELNVALLTDLSLNPIATPASDGTSWMAIGLLYDSLARIDPDTLLPEPWVAKEWTVDGDVVSVTLRSGVMFHQGGEVQAADIVYTFTNSQALKANPDLSSLLSGIQVEEIDTYEVRFDLSGYANKGFFFSEVLTLPILPVGFTSASVENGCGPFVLDVHNEQATWEFVNDLVDEDVASNATIVALHHYYNHGLVSGSLHLYVDDQERTSGFTFFSNNGTILFSTPLSGGERVEASYTYLTRYTRFTSFSDYFKTGKPYLAAVNYTVFPDVDGAAKALINGFVDFIGFKITGTDTTDLRWPGTVWETSLQKGDVTVMKNPGYDILYLGMNTQISPLDNATFREAISKTLDREIFSTEIETDVIAVDSVVVPSNTYWYNTSVPRFRLPRIPGGVVLDEAMALLDQAGFIDQDNDGWRDMPDGTHFNFTVFIHPIGKYPKKSTVGRSIVLNLQRVGINAIEWELDPEDVESRVIADDFDMYLAVMGTREDPSFMYDILHSGLSTNWVNYADPVLDDILEAMNSEIDLETRREHAMEAQGRIALDVPLAPLLAYKVVDACSKPDFEGWVSTTGGLNNFWTYLELHLIYEGSLSVNAFTVKTQFDPGEKDDLQIMVKDQDGLAVEGATVTIEVTYGGMIEGEGPFITQWDGTVTPAPVFNATDVQNVTDVTITVTASKEKYIDGVTTWNVTVQPLTKRLLVTIGREDETIESDELTTITVDVIDSVTKQPVPGATIYLQVSPEGLGGEVVDATGTTDANGHFETSFTGTVSIESTFTVTATASLTNYTSGSASTSIIVTRKVVQVTPGLDAVAMVFVVALLALLYGHWDRRKRSRDS